jgi:hypothetical protein
MIGPEKKYQPHPNFARCIHNGQTTFSGVKGIDEYQISLANLEYDYVIDLFESKEPFTFKNLSFDNLMQRFMTLRGNVLTTEDPMRNQLKEIALQTITDLYNLPELKWDIEFSLESMINYESDKTPLDIDRSRMEFLNEEVKKRKILNSLVHGSSMHIWKSIHHIVKDEIRQLSPVLFSLYDSYVSTVGFIIWLYDPLAAAQNLQNGSQFSQGVNSIQFGDEETTIHVRAVNFPTMLHEINKGALDLIVCHGLPDNVSKDELKYIYREADKYEDEVWHYTISPAIWSKLITQLSLPSQALPEVIMKISKLSLSQLEDILDLTCREDSYLLTQLRKLNVIS